MEERKTAPSPYRRIGRPILYGLVGVIIIGVLGYFLYIELRPVVSPAAPLLTSLQAATPAPSDPISSGEKNAYTVPAENPKLLTIDKLGISARIIPMGITKTGALDSPKTAWDAGWYTGSSKPGTSGALLVDGHVNDTRNTLGVFGQLHTLISGDLVRLERGDGTLFIYRVVATEQLPVEQVDMTKLMKPITVNRQGLNLITCGGKYSPQGQTFSDRVIVYAEQV